MLTQATQPNAPAAAVTAASTITQAAEDAQASGKDDFMKIFLAQLKNQDPMEPLDNKEMVAQLAQLNSLEQAIETNRQLGSLKEMAASQSGTQMANLLGKQVDAAGTAVHWDASDGSPTSFGYTLHTPAEEVALTLHDAQGNAVRTLRQPAPAVGVPQQLVWNGLGQGGTPVPSGSYSVSMAAKRGKAIDSMEPRLVGTATGVGFDAQGGSVMLGGARVRLQDIRQIGQ
jgi:flagellar basal-body rod modification protein FlgD